MRAVLLYFNLRLTSKQHSMLTEKQLSKLNRSYKRFYGLAYDKTACIQEPITPQELPYKSEFTLYGHTKDLYMYSEDTFKDLITAIIDECIREEEYGTLGYIISCATILNLKQLWRLCVDHKEYTRDAFLDFVRKYDHSTFEWVEPIARHREALIDILYTDNVKRNGKHYIKGFTNFELGDGLCVVDMVGHHSRTVFVPARSLDSDIIDTCRTTTPVL